MKRSFYDLNIEFESKRRCKSNRDDLLAAMEKWCVASGVTISKKVKFGNGCAGHGLLSTESIKEGEELAMIPRSATLYHSDRLQNEFKKFTKIKNHPWISVILSLISEWSNPDSKWRAYIDWLPDVGTLTLPHGWSENFEQVISDIGLKEQIHDDRQRMDDDFQIALNFIKKNQSLFPYTEQELRTLYYHCAFLMMSYSFTDPEEEEDSDDINLVEGDFDKPEPRRFMLPVGDLLNHTWDNNARIEFGDNCLTINAIKDIEPNQEIFNTFGDMSNSRLLQMYGFTEGNNPYDDVYLIEDVIRNSAEKHEIEAKNAKIKLLDSLGFFSEVRLSSHEELDDQLMAVLAVLEMKRKDFNKMVKETKKKSNNGQIEELEIELESNSVSDLSEGQAIIFKDIISATKYRLLKLDVGSDTMIKNFLGHLVQGSLSLLDKCLV